MPLIINDVNELSQDSESTQFKEEFSVKESRGQPKNGALNQAIQEIAFQKYKF